MQLILGRCINGHKVSDHVTFLAATNKKSDRAGVSGILEPVNSRFAAIVELQYEAFKGAAGEGLANEFVGFLRVYQTLPDPDSILADPGRAIEWSSSNNQILV